MKITLIGSGKVATQLALQLHLKNHQIIQIYSPTLQNAKTLAQKVNASPTNHLPQITTPCDICIIAINDDAIQQTANQLSKILHKNTLLVHTSGSVSTQVLSQHQNYGSFYPLQSFSMQKTPNWQTLPILLHANNETAINKLQRLAKSITKHFEIVNNQQRQQLHLAAVFANNFSNHLFVIAEQILQNTNLSFQLLKPLIAESIEKIDQNSPKTMQTGPAIRHDAATIQQHLHLLQDQAQLAQLYQLFTQMIQQTHQTK